jgi:uncharacterized protein YecE (DUF72 family)
MNFGRFFVKTLIRVEFGATFYNNYNPEEINRWTAQVAGSPEFKFWPKFPQTITHIRRLINAEKQTLQLYESLSGFGSHWGNFCYSLAITSHLKVFLSLKCIWKPYRRQ